MCRHLQDTVALAQLQTNTGLVVRHHHNPITTKTKGKIGSDCTGDGSNGGTLADTSKKKVAKKKKPFSGVKVSQMLAAREAEKQRINQVGLSLLSMLLTNLLFRSSLSRKPSTRPLSSCSNPQCTNLTNQKHKTSGNPTQCKSQPKVLPRRRAV